MFIVGKDIFKIQKIHPLIISALSKIIYKFVYWHVTIFCVLFMFILIRIFLKWDMRLFTSFIFGFANFIYNVNHNGEWCNDVDEWSRT
jgi:hypothetical protein